MKFIPFLMCFINIPFIVQDPSRWYNWISAIFCFSIGIIMVIKY